MAYGSSAELIAKRNGKASAVFIEMLGADSIEARRTALETLAKLGPKASSAIPALINLAEGMEPAPAQPDDSNLAYLTFKTIIRSATAMTPARRGPGTDAQVEGW